MGEIDDIAKTIETVRDSVAVIKAAAGDREEWALRFEEAASGMLSLVEELGRSISDIETVVSGKMAGPIRKVLEGFEMVTAEARTALDEAGGRLKDQLESSQNLVAVVSGLSGELPDISKEIRAAVSRMAETESEVIGRVSAVVDELQGSVVAEINKLAFSVAALHDTLPQAVAGIIGNELTNLRGDFARLVQEMTAVGRASQKSTLDAAAEMHAVSVEVRELKEMIEELSLRKRGFFKN